MQWSQELLSVLLQGLKLEYKLVKSFLLKKKERKQQEEAHTVILGKQINTLIYFIPFFDSDPLEVSYTNEIQYL